MKKMNLGKWAYLIGVFGAIIVGLLTYIGTITMTTMISTVLIIAGLLIGWFNIQNKERIAVMIASLVLGAGAGVLSGLQFVGELISNILTTFAFVFVPVGIMVAFMTLWEKFK